MKHIKLFWESLDDMTTILKKEWFLELVACTLAGFVLGIIFSPKKTTIIGCNNGNGHLDAQLDDQIED